VLARAAALQQPVDTSRFDARLLRNLPVDVRVVLAWDTDNTDIDLHVIDPNSEKADYSHQLTYHGSQMSRDFRGGLRAGGIHAPQCQARDVHRQGPFLRAPAADPVRGHDLMLRLTTGFGTPHQNDSDIVLRLSGPGRDVLVGTFEVHAPAQAAQAAR
jgi:hypothetical protein